MIKSSFSSLVCILLLGCSGLEQSQQEKIRQINAQKEAIYRSHSDQNYAIDIPSLRHKEAYPWESSSSDKYPKITKEFFGCKGSANHPARHKETDPSELVFDCDGLLDHSLPVRKGKEFIYPVLIDILNFVQQQTGHKVIITCGHRCPAHNSYADGSIFNTSSKHMIGAEVDFYVEGMENNTNRIVDIIMDYYKQKDCYRGQKEFEKFLRLDSTHTNVSTQPWYNKEILIKIYQKHEGRDLDNRHPYPYLSIQVRYDRELSEKVTYSWDKAFKGFLRY